jgi:hypothetical protein
MIETKRKRKRSILGTGIFVIFETSDSGLVASIIHRITYQSCCKKGQRYLAYKWVSNPVWESYLRSADGARGSTNGELDENLNRTAFGLDIDSASLEIEDRTSWSPTSRTTGGLGFGLDEHGCTPCEVWNGAQCIKVRTGC